MKIVFLDSETVGPDIDFSPFEKLGEFIRYENTTKDTIDVRIKDADILIVNKTKITKEIINSSTSLKLICVAATGVNNIDIDSANKKDIVVRNVAGYSTDSVVQLTYSMILFLAMRLNDYDQYVKSGKYSKSNIFTHYAHSFNELKNKQIGIIGMGAIGKKSAEIATAFGAKVVYYSTSGKNNSGHYQRLSLEALLSASDIVCIHAPLNENTRNLINAKNLKLMKSNALLINTGRGGIVNESDLAKAIDSGIIFGAGIDVFSREPLPEDNPLLHLMHPERVILTPHIAWCSIEARKALMKGVENNIIEWMKEVNHNLIF